MSIYAVYLIGSRYFAFRNPANVPQLGDLLDWDFLVMFREMSEFCDRHPVPDPRTDLRGWLNWCIYFLEEVAEWENGIPSLRSWLAGVERRARRLCPQMPAGDRMDVLVYLPPEVSPDVFAFNPVQVLECYRDRIVPGWVDRHSKDPRHQLLLHYRGLL